MAVRIILILALGLLAYLFHNLQRILRKGGSGSKPMRGLSRWLFAFTAFFAFMQVFWLTQWLQTYGYIATPLSLEAFGATGAIVNLVLALLIAPIYAASRRILEGLRLAEMLKGRPSFIYLSRDLLKNLKGRLSTMFGGKSAKTILYALGKEEGAALVGTVEAKFEGLSHLLKLLEVEGFIEKGEYGLEGRGVVEVILHGSVEAEGVESNLPVCDFISGWLAGSLERATGLQASAVEEQCTAKGDPYCRFRIKLSSQSLDRLEEIKTEW
ncbi:MAG: V4R domain-containing protein [Candidatus Bathyarchaeia archaeon]